jgi:hypothetical protein
MGTLGSHCGATMGSNNRTSGPTAAKNATDIDVPLKCSPLTLELEEHLKTKQFGTDMNSGILTVAQWEDTPIFHF